MKLKTWQELTKKETVILSNIPTFNVLEEYKGVQLSFKNENDMENYLKEKANEFLKKYFNTNIDIPVNINNRLKAVYGNFHSMNEKPFKIDINGDYLKYTQDDISSLLDTLYHECVHYVLCKNKVRDDDSDLIFDTILNRLNITTNYQYQTGINSLYNLYSCECGHIKYVLDGTKKPRKSYPWVICEDCQDIICLVRQEVGKRTVIANSFANDTLLRELFNSKVKA